jgi:hypothetical protein
MLSSGLVSELPTTQEAFPAPTAFFITDPGCRSGHWLILAYQYVGTIPCQSIAVPFEATINQKVTDE